MTMFKVLIVFCLFGNALAFVEGQHGTCPEVSTVENFNQVQFLGTWYTISTSSPRYVATWKCAKDEMSLNTNGTMSVVSIHIQRATGNEISIPSLLHIEDPTKIERMTMTRIGLTQTLDYWVAETDYTSYAFIYACANYGTNHIVDGTFITRAQHPSESTMARVEKLLEKYHLPKSSLEKVKQVECEMIPS